MAKKAKKTEEEKTVIEIIKPSIEEQILGASDEVKTVKVVDYASLKRRYKVENIVKNRSYELNGYEIGAILGIDNNARKELKEGAKTVFVGETYKIEVIK